MVGVILVAGRQFEVRHIGDNEVSGEIREHWRVLQTLVEETTE
jgi:hypothetical protein